MKRSVIILTFLATIFSIQAQIFNYNNRFYKVIEGSANKCETWAGDEDATLQGDIVIPETVYFKSEPYTVVSIGERSFYADKITSVKIPETVKAIGEEAFCRCMELKEAALPSRLGKIGKNAFSNTQITSINIPARLYDGINEAFRYCKKLVTDENGNRRVVGSITEITLDPNNRYYSLVDGVLFNKDQTHIILYPNGRENKSYTVPNSVTRIESYCFNYSTYLYQIRLPEGLKLIGSSSFQNCSNLTDITLPESLEIMWSHPFECTGLKEINIPKNVTQIGPGAGIPTISATQNPFTYCENLNRITVDPASQYFCSVDGVLYDKGMTTLVAYPLKKQDRKYDIPYGVTTLGSECMFGAHIDEITFPETIKTIWENAVMRTKIRQIALPDYVEFIGWDAFSECDNLTEVCIGDHTQKIDKFAFSRNKNLHKIYIGADVEEIGSYAFSSYDTQEVYYAANHLKSFGTVESCIFDKSAFEKRPRYISRRQAIGKPTTSIPGLNSDIKKYSTRRISWGLYPSQTTIPRLKSTHCKA